MTTKTEQIKIAIKLSKAEVLFIRTYLRTGDWILTKKNISIAVESFVNKMVLSCEKKKQYYNSNKEKIKVRVEKYKEANREMLKARGERYSEANKERKKVREKKYREANKEKIKVREKKYRAANKDATTARNKKYTANLTDSYLCGLMRIYKKDIPHYRELIELKRLQLLGKRKVKQIKTKK